MTAHRRAYEIFLTGAIAIAVIGLIGGVEGTSGEVVPPAPADPYAPPPPREARSYRDMRDRDYGPNRELPALWFDGIGKPPDLMTPVVQSDADRAAALDRRASRRAYDGAPPTIPHPVDQHATPGCLACHEHGARVAGLVAPVMSHARHDSCLQCHVVERDPRRTRATPPVPETTFVGRRPHAGERAWPGAPPTIPHATAMRDRCDSCHGPYGALGLRSTHPWRASCRQCHAASAALDQRPGGTP